MPVKKRPEKPEDILIVDKPDDIRLIMSEKHNRILKLVTDRELSISEIAKALGMNPGSIYYRLKELEEHGLIRQVREEIKGGIVKKYYRAAAKRIVLESPRFGSRDGPALPPADFLQRLIRSLEGLGYHLPPENREDADDLLLRYDRRMKALMVELNRSGLEEVEDDGFILNTAFGLILGLKVRNDPEMGRLYAEFEKLFLRYE